MEERNTQGCFLEAAPVASLSLHEASRRQSFRIPEEHSRSKFAERRFGEPAVNASSAAAGKPIKNQGTAEIL